MSHLKDKGIRSKRLMLTLFLLLLVTVDYKYGDNNLKPEQWLDFIKWLFGFFALSEVGKAGAESFRDHNKGGSNV